MKKLIALLLSFGSFVSHAQAPSPTVRADSAIHLNVVQNGRYSSAFYTVNQEPLTAVTVKRLLRHYPPAAAELRKGRAQTRWALALLPVMAGAMLVAKQQTDPLRYAPGSAFSKAPVPFSVLLGALIGYCYLMSSNTHFAKAVEAYNQQFH